jgi:hypothetical protein
MAICQCIKNNGQKCTRETSTKIGDNSKFCWQHQKCNNIYGGETKVAPVRQTQSVPVKQTQSAPVRLPAPVPILVVDLKTSEKNGALLLLINEFITKIKNMSYANECYDWSCAEKIIRDNLIGGYDELESDMIPHSDKLHDYSYGDWDNIRSLCMGFDIDKLANEDSTLAGRLVQTNVDMEAIDFMDFMAKLYYLKFGHKH